jgi:hypothetical protein
MSSSVLSVLLFGGKEREWRESVVRDVHRHNITRGRMCGVLCTRGESDHYETGFTSARCTEDPSCQNVMIGPFSVSIIEKIFALERLVS